jgi:hypothetical protein
MGLWGGIKKIGGLYGKGLKGIGKGIGKVGKKLGQEVRRGFDPIVKGVQGDWKGALAGIGHNIKRAAQVGAVLGTGGVAGVGLGAIGAAGGAIEGGFKEGGGGFKDIVGGGIGGYGGVQTGKALGNIGRGVAGRIGGSGAEAVAGGMGGGGADITNTMMGTAPPIPAVPDLVSSATQGADWGNIAMASGNDTGNIGRSFASRVVGAGGDYLRENKKDLAMRAVGQLAGGGGAVDERYMPGAESMMDPRERERLEREALMREMMTGGGPQFQQYSGRWA